MRTSKIQNAHQGVSGVWKVLYPYVLWRSRQLLLNKIFDLRTPYMRKGCDGEKTSPPSAREAAMSAMQYEIFLKHLESFLETSMKHSGNTLENHETPLKHP